MDVPSGFSGVVRVDRAGAVILADAHGLANRAWGVPNTVATRFAMASGSKGFTALVVARLVEDGVLRWDTRARTLLGGDLPLIDDEVTVEQLLAHRSGIGDYFDEDAGLDINDYVLPVSMHELAETEQFLAVLDGFPAKFAPWERFAYCNGGFVVLALLAERAATKPFHELVRDLVTEPAGMHDTAYLRSDELPGGVALGYLDGLRTNVFHLPVRGSGDGGCYTTAADMVAFWRALFAGAIVREATLATMIEPRSDVPSEKLRYGLGFWLAGTGDAVLLEGYDAGVSFRSKHDPTSDTTYTVLANTSEGAWPVVRELDALGAR
ncbi:serine hydrolase domain-containing protein [Labedaea rhizosphaerae]|uniref:CubicO group peptidase (Beta-lactamase class C family) n=1 Tax=Labedaea rhizosphaerae TaxID=598644 RepID=A0A4R6RQI7_LABRH|nr:serine hydrolase domain-containing protein [Labedaea rhizosphaerae]TDP88970.1 CubicO group peptidase (beta-lactamase class C family) [Labedaea rhizosphaerae]